LGDRSAPERSLADSKLTFDQERARSAGHSRKERLGQCKLRVTSDDWAKPRITPRGDPVSVCARTSVPAAQLRRVGYMSRRTRPSDGNAGRT
jgi:hypothetical protein